MSPRPLLASEAALREHFHGEVRLAVRNQGLRVSPRSQEYVASLLHEYSRLSALPRSGPEVRFLHRPLFDLWVEALGVAGSEQLARLRTLGDLSLFVSGYFPEALVRRLVDVDYYISMGGHAYQRIAARLATTGSEALFDELARKFARFVDVLSEVSARTAGHRSPGVLRLYERWVRTRSAWIARQLAGWGVLPFEPGHTKVH